MNLFGTGNMFGSLFIFQDVANTTVFGCAQSGNLDLVLLRPVKYLDSSGETQVCNPEVHHFVYVCVYDWF